MGMVLTDRTEEIFTDARMLYEDALMMLEQNNLRNAAEKAWGATKRATDALILARTGDEPEKTLATSRALDELADRDVRAKSLVGRYYSRQSALRGNCFYLGLCEPIETTERRIRETAIYIQDAENLAINS